VNRFRPISRSISNYSDAKSTSSTHRGLSLSVFVLSNYFCNTYRTFGRKYGGVWHFAYGARPGNAGGFETQLRQAIL
jgi:hypothetical protein